MDPGPTEFQLIDRIRRRATVSGAVSTGIGDDAAITEHSGPTATSVDAIVEGVHFDRESSGPALIAHKAVATALSDLAAMAADPGEVYVTVGLPPQRPTGFAEELADGFVDAAERWQVVLAGGDTVSSPVLFVTVTAVGRAPVGERLLLRSAARPGDLVAVTGALGGAGAGLLLLGDETLDAGLSGKDREALLMRQLAPEPRLVVGRALRGSGVTALIDVSDGLAADLGHIATASGLAIAIDSEKVPVQVGVAEVAAAAGREPLDLAIGAGEDYELAMTVPPGRLEAVGRLVAATGSELTAIGTVSEGAGLVLRRRGSPVPIPSGFDHLA